MSQESKTARTERSSCSRASCGKPSSACSRVERLEAPDELAQVVGVELDVQLDAPLGLQGGQLLLEELPVHAGDDVPEHLQQAAVGVEGEALVPGRAREPLDRLVVEAEVEDRVHHPRHRDRRAGADGHEQRVFRVAEALPGRLLEPRDRAPDLVREPVREARRRASCTRGTPPS